MTGRKLLPIQSRHQRHSHICVSIPRRSRKLAAGAPKQLEQPLPESILGAEIRLVRFPLTSPEGGLVSPGRGREKGLRSDGSEPSMMIPRENQFGRTQTCRVKM